MSCIVTLPIYQRKGYGFFLISFSYLLSQRENRLGSPEKPLSDLGLLSYRSYWKTALANALLQVLDAGVDISIQELGKRTGMTDDDVVSGLEGLDALVRDPQTGIYAIKVNRKKLQERVDIVDKKGYVKVKEDQLKWTPYLLGRREAKEMLKGGLDALIRRRTTISLDISGQDATSFEEPQVQGKDIPPERFLSVSVRENVPATPAITYDLTEPRTPASAITAPTSQANSPSISTAEEDNPEDNPEDEDVESTPSSPSSPSIIEDEVSSDEPFSADDLDEEEDEMSDYISDDSNNFSPRKRRKLDRPNRMPPKMTPEVVMRVKQVARAPGSGGAFGSVLDTDGKPKPRVIAAKAPRSRAGHNPPEVMSRRTSLRRL